MFFIIRKNTKKRNFVIIFWSENWNKEWNKTKIALRFSSLSNSQKKSNTFLF